MVLAGMTDKENSIAVLEVLCVLAVLILGWQIDCCMSTLTR